MKASTALALSFLASLSLAGAASAHASPARSDPERGLVYSGLQRARADGPCNTAFELVLPRGRRGCTHGPDAAPAGRDVRRKRSLAELAASTEVPGGESAGAGGSTLCTGDGVSGNRVQAVYAYPVDSPDKSAELAEHIRRWAGVVDGVFNESAGQTGGVRHVRFVTGPDCQVDVAKVALSPAGVASLAGTVADLAAQGFDRPDRKYLVWVDAYVFCGLASVQPDDRASADNPNNGNAEIGTVARIDRGCWGGASPSIEAHELVHLLGGVQPSAANANDNYHCTDDADLMCYDDDGVLDGQVWVGGRLEPLRAVCPAWHERLLDCGHDDYFHTDPPLDSYLGSHWNVADSSFLTSEGPAATQDTTAPMPTGPIPRIVGTLAPGVPVELSWSADEPDVVGYWLWKSVDGQPWRFVPVANPWATRVVLPLVRGRSYRFLVHAYDAAGNASPAVFGPQFTVRRLEEGNRAIAYRGLWRRRHLQSASERRHAVPAGSRTRARLVFRGRAIAWVSRTGPRGGRVRVFVDGRYAATVSLSSPTVRPRTVVFSRRWSTSRLHTITVRPVGVTGRVSLDAFAVLR